MTAPVESTGDEDMSKKRPATGFRWMAALAEADTTTTMMLRQAHSDHQWKEKERQREREAQKKGGNQRPDPHLSRTGDQSLQPHMCKGELGCKVGKVLSCGILFFFYFFSPAHTQKKETSSDRPCSARCRSEVSRGASRRMNDSICVLSLSRSKESAQWTGPSRGQSARTLDKKRKKSRPSILARADTTLKNILTPFMDSHEVDEEAAGDERRAPDLTCARVAFSSP